MVFEDLLRPLCLCTCSSCVEEVARVHGSVKIASGMMNCKGKEGGREGKRERPEETQTEAGKAIISAGRGSEI